MRTLTLLTLACLVTAFVPSTAAAGPVAAGPVDTSSLLSWASPCAAPGVAEVAYDGFGVSVAIVSPCAITGVEPDFYSFDSRCEGDPAGSFTCTYTLDSGTTSTLTLGADGSFSYTYDHQSGYLFQATGTLARP